MIIVKNRTLMFSNREQYIGTPYDDSSTIRSFMIKRLSVDGIDIAHLSFRLNLRRMDGSEDSDYLEKNVTDERIVLNWTIDGGMLGEPGTAFISLRGHDATGTVKWSTYMAPVYVGEMVGLPDLDGNKLTELERLEVKFDIIHETEALRVQAELDRVNAEIERENNELKRENKEGEREKAESDRIIAENERKRLEEARILAEENRGNAEIIRKQSEESREKSEQEREVAEEERKANNENVKEIIQNANEVIGRAEGVVEAANAAVGKANTAADIAENATEEAREATQETQQATLMALEAAGRVDDAIDTANKAADNATTAAEKAYNSAENADIQAEFARNEASSASGAASEARAAARNAEKAADNADEAAESANAAAENANQAAENNNTLPLRVEALESEIAQTKSDLAEKASTEYVESEIADVKALMVQQTPLFAETVADCTDISKVYVLPDGYIYANRTMENPNRLDLGEVQVPYRLQDDSTEIIYSTSNAVTGWIPVEYGKFYSFSILFNGERNVGRANIVRMNVKHTDGSITVLGKSIPYASGHELNVVEIPSADVVAIQFQFRFIDGSTIISISTIADVAVYEPMFVVGNTATEALQKALTLDYVNGDTEGITHWVNTGHAFQPTDYEERIIELENDTNELKNDVEKLETSVLYEKNILNFGDSIAEGGANNSRHYGTIIAEKYGMDVVSKAVGGAVMVSGLSGTHSILTQIESAIATYGSQYFDFILLEGGTNDLNYLASGHEEIGIITDTYDGNYDVTTVIGALEKALYLIRTTWLSSNIIFVIPHHMSSRDYALSKQLWNACVEVCKKWGVPVANVFEEGQYNTYIASMNALYAKESDISHTGYDRTHPSEDGYKKWYCPLIVAKMKEVVFE